MKYKFSDQEFTFCPYDRSVSESFLDKGHGFRIKGAKQMQKAPGDSRRNRKQLKVNKAGYTATLVACGWAGAVKKS